MHPRLQPLCGFQNAVQAIKKMGNISLLNGQRGVKAQNVACRIVAYQEPLLQE
jgi:hypothetical protein